VSIVVTFIVQILVKFIVLEKKMLTPLYRSLYYIIYNYFYILFLHIKKI